MPRVARTERAKYLVSSVGEAIACAEAAESARELYGNKGARERE